jgi:hypothetical protein
VVHTARPLVSRPKPGANASNVGKTVQCRVEKNRLVIIDDRGKEQKYSLIGITQAK